MFKRITALALLLSTLALASCAGDAGSGTTTSAGDTTTVADTTVAETTTEVVNWKSSDVPQDADLDGFNLRFIERTPSYEITTVPWYLMDTDEQNGEVLNDAVYDRNRTIEEALNCDITLSFADSSSFTTNVQNAILANDNSFDVVFTYQSVVSTLQLQQLLVDLYTVPYLDLEQSWWDQALVRDYTINDKLFQITGDINASMDIRAFAMVFNKDLADDLGVEYPYQKVLDGEWTREYFENYVKGINSDLNGDGVMDDNDRWGFFSETAASMHFYMGWGGRISEPDNDGALVTKLDNQKNMNLLSEAMSIVTDTEVTLMADMGMSAELGWPGCSAWYMEGNALLRSSTFEAVPRDYRQSETDFGVLPFPKYDENQDEYLTTAAESGFVLCIPKTCVDLDSTGMILEALAAESVSTVAQAVYDVCLDGKYVRDEESADMIDIIFDNKVFDIAYMWNLGSFRSAVVNQVKAGNSEVASMIESNKPTLEAALLDQYEAHQ